MKIIGLGDTHGHDNWKAITAKEDFDKVVFIGDYFDSFDIPASVQLANFRDIIAYAQANKDRVVLLFGNHDFHYLPTTTENYSGYQSVLKDDIGELLLVAIYKGLMQMCYNADGFLFTHAGVTKTWCAANDIDLNNIEQSINESFFYKPNSFKFTHGKNRSNTGDDVTQSPIWVRPKSLTEDYIEGYRHVVGHTHMKRLTITDPILLIDTFDTSGEYLRIVDGIASAILPE